MRAAVNVVRLLFTSGMTPLMEAAFWDKIDMVELLLSVNAETHHKDFKGKLQTLLVYSPCMPPKR